VGDEPRYAYQGLGLYTAASLRPDEHLWQRFAADNHCGDIGIPPIISLSPSIVYGAAIAFAGIEAARWLCFVVGCAGLLMLYAALRPRFAALPALLALSAIALSLPFAPYLQLLYPEMLLFAAIAGGLVALAYGRYTAAAVVAALLPFIHLRASPLSLVLVTTVIALMLRDRRPVAAVIRAAVLYAFLIVVFVACQIEIYGSVTGSAFPTFAPSAALFVQRLGMQLYDVRHGAVAYAPLLLIGFAGLVRGALCRDRLSIVCTLLLVATVGTFMWSTAEESWEGRFWISALPFVAYGMAFWFSECSGVVDWLPAMPLAFVSAMVLVAYALHPLWFLESRQASVFYTALYPLTHVHIGLLLPVDAAGYAVPIGALLAFTVVAVAALAVCHAVTKRAWRMRACMFAGAVVLSPAVFALARTAPADAVVFPSRGTIVVHLGGDARRADGVQFDALVPAYWSAPAFPATFSVRCMHASTPVSESVLAAIPLIRFPGCTRVDTIVITGLPAASGRDFYRHPGPVRVIYRLL
jgi:hypothetical protein